MARKSLGKRKRKDEVAEISPKGKLKLKSLEKRKTQVEVAEKVPAKEENSS